MCPEGRIPNVARARAAAPCDDPGAPHARAEFAGGRQRARGFAAIAAIFILVVLALLGAALVSIFGGQQRGSAYDALGMQAYQAARAGIEFGANRALVASSCPASTSFALPGTLSAFTVRVDCASSVHTEGATSVTVYRLTATACNRATCPGTSDATYVERELRMTIGSSAP